jgi:glycosyltransferase involved in cell wall biosynthesis
VADGDYDVVYGQGLTLSGRLPRTAPPSVFNPHGLELCTIPGAVRRLKAWPLRIEARRQARQAQRTISLGGDLTRILTSCLGVSPAKIAVIPNGVDPTEFTRDDSLRDPRLVLFVGRLFQNKGPDVLCRSLPYLPADARIVIAGDGPLRSALAATFRDPRIVFAGPVSENELRRLYRSAAVLALPTRSEGMPTVILEAFCCGTPVVATNVGAISELVDETTGELIEAADARLLGAALRRILTLDPSARQRLGDAARERAVTRFSWPAVATATLDLLAEVAAT